jgi:hypothetical protein
MNCFLDTSTLSTINLIKASGPPYDIDILDYCNGKFSISFKTADCSYLIECQGNPTNLFNFNPKGGWKEWEKLAIMQINSTDQMEEEGIFME